MTGFLAGLVARNAGTSTAVRPRVASVFESATDRRLSMIDSADMHETDLSPEALERDSSSRATSPDSRDIAASATASRPAGLPIEDRRTTQPIQPAPSSGPPLLPAALSTGAAGQAADTGVRPRRSSEPDQIRIQRLVETGPAFQPSREPPTSVTEGHGTTTAVDDEPSVRRSSEEERGLLVAPDVSAQIASELQRALSGRDSKRNHRPDERARSVEPNAEVRAEQQINVTIGRVEVRATTETRPPNRVKAPSPVMSLDDYLTRGARGAGR